MEKVQKLISVPLCLFRSLEYVSIIIRLLKNVQHFRVSISENLSGFLPLALNFHFSALALRIQCQIDIFPEFRPDTHLRGQSILSLTMLSMYGRNLQLFAVTVHNSFIKAEIIFPLISREPIFYIKTIKQF